MKNLALTAALLALLSAALPAQEENRSIRLRPDSGKLVTGQSLTLYFPEAMVAADEIGKTGLPSPLVFEPEVGFDLVWKSQTEARIRIAAQPHPGTRYVAKLKAELAKLDGEKVDRARWINRSFDAPPLTVTARPGHRGKVSPQLPSVGLGFNYAVRYSDAAKSVYFIDRDSRERFTAEILLPGLGSEPSPDEPAAPEGGTGLQARPLEPLPADRTIDLVVENIRDAYSGTPIEYLKSFPLGITSSLRMNSAHAVHDALSDPSIQIYFNQSVDPETVTTATVRVEPAVEGLKRVPYRASLRLEGAFDPAGKYTVFLEPGLKGTGGYPLAGTVAEDVEFEGLVPSIYFPTTQYFTRSGLGLNLKFLHANTAAIEWKLAPLPEHKIGVARSRLHQTGERLIDQLGLKSIAGGTFPEAPSVDGVYRDIVWKPEAGKVPAGAYLVEVCAPLRSGKLAANRAVVFFNDVFVTQKQTGAELWAKVQSMADSEPVAGAKARLVSNENTLLATATTGDDGIARFDRSWLTRSARASAPRASHMLIDAPGGGTAMAFTGGRTFHNSGWASEKDAQRRPVGSIFSDRNLYRPGTTAKFKGIVRIREDGKLSNASGHQVSWKITQGYRGQVVASGSKHTDELGGWEIEWPVPKDTKLGGYRLVAENSKNQTVGSAYVNVEEYRVPLFEIGLARDGGPAGKSAKVRVQSNYFHGGANAGAVVRWTLDWSRYISAPSDGTQRGDRYSQHRRPAPNLPASSGELRLDASGSGLIEVEIPGGADYALPRYGYSLDVDVVSPEGRTISDGFYGTVQPVDHVLGVSLNSTYEDDKGALSLRLTAFDADNNPVDGLPVKVALYRIEARTVKEKVGENLFRYRNFQEHMMVGSVESKTSAEGDPLRVDVGGIPGRYVAVARLAGSPQVSDGSTLAGKAPARYAVYDGGSFGIDTDKEEYLPGETAALALKAPFGGKAWVSVETDRILEQFVVDLEHNAAKIDLPIKSEYFPNAYATVYLVRPGGADRIPAERFGRVRLKVNRPDLQIEVAPVLAQSQIEPGASGHGTVFVTAGGEPVAGADVTVMAVDEAVLKLGGWGLPSIFNTFYPHRQHHVSTHRALGNHHDGFDEEDVTEKGFVIGGGGPGGGQKRKKPRENFLARAFWKTGLRTDADGKVDFDFTAPDNLTRFRVTAVAFTKDNRFGDGKTDFRVDKRLMVEPALPRFVRHGDEIILRAVARQKPMDAGQILISCSAGEGLELLGPAAGEIGPLAPGVPGTFGVRARVKSGVSEVKVRFDATIAGHSDITDEVEVTLPVFVPGVMQRTGLYGKVPKGATEFVLAKIAPKFWGETEGDFGLTLSRSPFVPKLQGLPEILEYPHGCFEQRSSKLLAYTQLAALLEYLPELGDRHKNYRSRIEEGLRYYSVHLRSDGFLPYWAGSSKRNAFVTVLAAWVTDECRKLGYTIPANLNTGFPKALDDIVRGRADVGRSNSTRALALYVGSRSNPKKKPVDILQELYLKRDRMGDESRSFLALAMHGYDVMPAERQLLVREIDNAPPRGAFDPRDFYSPRRAKAVAYIAQTRIADPEWQRELEPVMRKGLFSMLDDSRNLSTQENLWLLMAMVSMMEGEDYKALGKGADLASGNGFSVGWRRRALERIGEIGFKVDDAPTYYLVDANVLRDMKNAKREDRGLRIERVLKNMTDPERTGSAEKPYRLGDEILITYRLQSDKTHHYLALVDELPAGLETVNFNLAQVAEFYKLPEEAERNSLYLDHSELRDRSANLYFNRLNEGAHTYSLLARVTSAGQFAWPATDLTPMYEPRFGALGAPSWVFATEK